MLELVGINDEITISGKNYLSNLNWKIWIIVRTGIITSPTVLIVC